MGRNIIDFEGFWRIWFKLIQLSRDNWAIIVEGNRDKEILEKLDVKDGVIVLQKFGLRRISDLIIGHYKGAIILTDFDSEGEELANRLRSELTMEGVKINVSIREELKKILHKMGQIENLNKIFDELEQRAPFYIYNELHHQY